MSAMEARLTVLECSQERIAEHQHKAEDTVMTILEGFQRRFEEIEYSTPINFGQEAVPKNDMEFRTEPEEESINITPPLVKTGTVSFVEATVYLDIEKTLDKMDTGVIVKKGFASEAVSYATLTLPWRPANRPWSKKEKAPQQIRKFNLLLNQATFEKNSASRIGDMWREDTEFTDNSKMYLDTMINQVIRHPRMARLNMHVLYNALVMNENARHTMDCLFAIFENHTKFQGQGMMEKTKSEQHYRGRLCALLMMLGELLKHGAIEDISGVDKLIRSLHAGRLQRENDSQDSSFAMMWLFNVKKNLKGVSLSSLAIYDDDCENYVARKIPKWKRSSLYRFKLNQVVLQYGKDDDNDYGDVDEFGIHLMKPPRFTGISSQELKLEASKLITRLLWLIGEKVSNNEAIAEVLFPATNKCIQSSLNFLLEDKKVGENYVYIFKWLRWLESTL
ncbi:hypothetical protein QR680_007673 [Steinernema hermaphroditum]|uniref:Uncharacterized protein n=1 Tax=Steinernema hermaphroditum TaxID=289476 RepID=A0AA39IDX8_9BILA|nr:hypothetical protein QR680_007673 [Steinernema hermaphroditum]